MMEGTEKMRFSVLSTFLLLGLLAWAFGQTSPVPYAPNSDGPGPTFTNSLTAYSFPGKYSSVRKVDFRNLKFPIFDADAKPAGSISFKNGRYKKDEPFYHYSESLDSIHYLSENSSSREGSALVVYSWSGVAVSSSSGGTAQVFTLSDGRLRSVQKIGWDTHFQAGQPTDSFDSGTNTLVIRSAHYIPGDAHCCVSAMDVVTFHWNGSLFVQTGLQTELSEYGREEGKALPH